ncbi:S46 family peptidase [uncultured Alistipes sp.]|uniref:S46 family peptidase n=1 Tax=uncultured Alistipes sp. TaxID=538949 RepID=UPI0032B166E5
MKKLIAFAAAVTVAFTAAADEGMWLLPYLQKMNGKDMKSKGCKLSPEEIYSANRSSLKDAIVIFGGGCTGEIVSPEGLLFTNHHCGYGSIQALSSVEHDYLKYGFWAMSNEEELPVEGLAVRFIREIRDVTPELVGNVPSIAGEQEYRSIVEQNRKALLEQLQAEHPDKEVIVRSFFGGNQYFAFIIDVFRDVRLVGTPPSSIGKFGGETDNWMWPRHTGDFSIFRVYADRENKPAAYSPDNVPYKAEKYLTVSTKGYKEGDFTMIMGFPGSTQRYMTSYEIDNMLDIENPQRIFIRGERQAILKEDMAASDKVRIQYASKYAGSSNYWKNSIGMSRGLKRLNVKAKKQEQEASFRRWAAENTLPEEGYIDALDKIERAVKGNSEPKALRQYLGEAFYNAVEILVPGRTIERLAAKGDTIPVEQVRDLREAFADWYGDYSPSTDRKVAKRMLTIARENMKRLPSFYTEIIDKEFGGDIDAYVDDLYDRSVVADEQKTLALLENWSAAEVADDPVFRLVCSIDAFSETVELDPELQALYAEGHRKYIAGLMRQFPDKSWASDANFTIRLTYGQVLPYRPADGVKYDYYTTLKGVMEKENPDNAEFVVPAKLRELYEAGDYGRYANERGELPVAFLANCDITGGNSGSPIMNGRGELIGLAFDGNWEAMSGDVAFEPELQRTISVDVRYVLFIIDKFAGAGWLLDEMNIR